jgi:hypothetical protein
MVPLRGATSRLLAEQLQGVGVADIGSIERGRASDRIAGDLDERPQIVVELAGDEAGNLLRDEIVVGVRPRRLLPRIEIRLRAGEG